MFTHIQELKNIALIRLSLNIATYVQHVLATLKRRYVLIFKRLTRLHLLQMPVTTRNVFIANLALSDLLLCCFTMPVTLADLVTLYWPLGPDKVQEIDTTAPATTVLLLLILLLRLLLLLLLILLLFVLFSFYYFSCYYYFCFYHSCYYWSCYHCSCYYYSCYYCSC